jgi:hypothetical protein
MNEIRKIVIGFEFIRESLNFLDLSVYAMFIMYIKNKKQSNLILKLVIDE